MKGIFATIAREGSIRQADPPPRRATGAGSEDRPTEKGRGRGRPTGSKSKADSRKGKSSGRHPLPDLQELARMGAMVAFRRVFPALAHTMTESEIDRLERVFEEEIRNAMKRAGKED